MATGQVMASLTSPTVPLRLLSSSTSCRHSPRASRLVQLSTGRRTSVPFIGASSSFRASSFSKFASGSSPRDLLSENGVDLRAGGPRRQGNVCFDSILRVSSPVCVAASGFPLSKVVSAAAVVLSRAMVAAAVISEALMRAARGLCQALTATHLPNPNSSAEKDFVAALKGRLVLAAGPLFFAAISQSGSVSTPLTVVASGMAKWLELYSGVLMVRVLLSWFPNIPWERQPLQAVRDMCDPYLNLFRNIIPPLFNALDLSPMLAFMVLGVLTSILNTTVQG